MSVSSEQRLRLMLGDPTNATRPESEAFFSNAVIESLLEEFGTNLYAAAAEGWGMRAAYFVEAVDVMENGSDRKLSQLHKHATERQKYYEAKSEQHYTLEEGAIGVVGQSFEIGVDEEEPIENWFPYDTTRMPVIM